MNVLIHRVPLGASIISPASSCTKCSHKIKPYDNIPLLSYIILKGKCRYCGEKISLQYPLVELTVAIMFSLIYYKFGLTFISFKYILFTYILVLASFTDVFTKISGKFETGVVPTIYMVFGIISALIFGFYEDNFINSLAGLSAGYLVLYLPSYIYKLVRKIEGMGEADFMIFAMVGGYLGVNSIPLILTISSFIGLFIAIFVVLITGNKRYPIPFVPMLSVGAIAYIFWSNL